MEHEQRHGGAHHGKDLYVNSLQRTVLLMMKRTTEQITDVSRGNKHSRLRWDRTVLLQQLTMLRCRRRETRSREDYSEIQGQTRQHSEVISLQ